MQDSPFLTSPQKRDPPYNVDNPMIGVGFIILLIGAVLGFQLGRWSVKQDAKSSISPTLKSSPIPTNITEGGCLRAGCSSELCVESSESDINTPCVYKEEYSCLTYSRCERQKNGECGWTQTAQYSQCLQNFQRISK